VLVDGLGGKEEGEREGIRGVGKGMGKEIGEKGLTTALTRLVLIIEEICGAARWTTWAPWL
jgi:hypothetical protein